MALDEIYHVNVHLEGPSRPASFGVYYQELGLADAVVSQTQSLAESFDAALSGRITNLMSSAWELSGYTARKVSGNQIAKFIHSTGGRAGTRPAQALPANNAILVQLFQVSHPKTSNGRLYIPGLSENDSVIGRINAVFAGDELLSFTTRIAQAVLEIEGTGHWVPGVVSAKVRDANPGFKDWEGAFSPMVGALGWPVIARQRRRQTRVVGAF